MSLTPEQIKVLDDQVLDDQVRGVATHLGWEFDEEYATKHERGWGYYSQLKNGMKALGFSTGDYKFKDRWSIRAIFPRDDKGQLNTAYNFKWPEMTVSMAKTPEQIAKNIKSRLIPEYERQLAEVLIKIESSNRYHSGKLAQIIKVATYLGLPTPTDDNRMSLYPGHETCNGHGVHRIEAYSEDKVKFEVEIGADKAIEILKLLGY